MSLGQLRADFEPVVSEDPSYRTYFDESPDPILVITQEDQRFVDSNPAFERFFGHRRQDASGRSLSDLQLWFRASEQLAFFNLLDAQAEIISVEAHLRTFDGKEIVCLLSAKKLRVQGRACLLLIIGDITRQQRDHLAILTHRNALQAVLDNFPFMVWLKDVEGHFLAINQPFAKACSYVRTEDLQGKTDLDIWPRDLAEKYINDDRAVMKSRRKKMVEELIDDRGERRWFETYKSPIIDSTGQVIGTTGFAHDISARKKAELELRLAAQVFERSREKIVIMDADTKIVSVNRAFTEIAGFDLAEVLAKELRALVSDRHDDAFYSDIWRLTNSQGYWQGEMWMCRSNGGTYPERMSITAVRDDMASITHYICIGTDVTEQKVAEERINYLAHYDVLTNLPNRLQLQQHMARILGSAAENSNEIAVLFIDLDRFKNINDSLGHQTGDKLLQSVAMRLKKFLRSGDLVARLGGDEFVLALVGAGSAIAERVCRELLQQLSVPFKVDNLLLAVTPSIGVSIYPHHGNDISTLIKSADTALYHAKGAGRNNFKFFTEQMNVDARLRMDLETGLRAALERNELAVHYQPQYDLQMQRLIGHEALMRWRHPVLGQVSPASFIPVAEDSGLIIPIGDWLLREACRQNVEWQRSGRVHVPVSVNLSAAQFWQQGLVISVKTALADTGMEPRYLELELTESVIMNDADSTITTLRVLADLGVQIAIDDFGTGYSSLSYLKRFPIDKLKIDRTFVRDVPGDLDDAAIVNAITNMAHSLRMRVIAEGVETPEQLEFLQTAGVDEVQGFLFGRPQAPEHLNLTYLMLKGSE